MNLNKCTNKFTLSKIQPGHVFKVDEEPEWELKPSNRILIEGRGTKIKCIARFVYKKITKP